ncbi:MAG: M15 family metallopeptidase [Bacteroidota bacterium]
MVRLVEAYPEILIGIRNDSLLWCDGSLLPFDEPRPFGSFQDMLNEADLRAQMTQRYPVGKEYALPRINQDPGRVRNSAFFKKMYGATKEEVEASLVEVRWLPSRGNQSLRVTSVNGVADKLHAISLALDSLPDSLLRFVQPPVGGTYAWRPIAGTDRLSMHSFGMAIDIVVANSHYWRWDHPAEDLPIPYQNRIPWAIVEIFERYGFIWGGKWYHYDTMHFEYRPELFPRGTNFHP